MIESKRGELVREAHARQLLGAGKSTLFTSRKTGELWGHPAPKFVKIGGRIYYPRDEITTFLDRFKLVRRYSDMDGNSNGNTNG